MFREPESNITQENTLLLQFLLLQEPALVHCFHLVNSSLNLYPFCFWCNFKLWHTLLTRSPNPKSLPIISLLLLITASIHNPILLSLRSSGRGWDRFVVLLATVANQEECFALNKHVVLLWRCGHCEGSGLRASWWMTQTYESLSYPSSNKPEWG